MAAERSAPWARGPGALLALFALAAAARVGFALWAPGVPHSDGRFYHYYAVVLLDHGSYVNADGSPAIRWMPGWPAFLACVYGLFGHAPRVGMVAGGLLDAATAVVVAALGTRLLGRGTGLLAGALYALWPGIVFYAGTLFSEPLYNLLFASTLLLLVPPPSGEARPAREIGAGVAFGLAAYVKSEPLVLAPALLLALWRLDPSPRAFLRRAVALLGVAGALLLPWTLRNYLVFDRFIPTSASGGVVVELANHPGATGGQDFRRNLALSRRYRGENLAQTTINRNDAGWGQAWRFAREHPGDLPGLVARKLRLTYGGDVQALRTLRGTGPPEDWHVAPTTFRALARLANAFWWPVLALAGLGLLALRGRPPGTAALLVGPLATWWVLHAVFLGGQRFHAPEAPLLALLAALALATVAGRGRAQAPPTSNAAT